SICDTEPEEHERQHTLAIAAVHAKKDGVLWNLVDTPGYPEFIGDSLSAMLATDLAVGVVSCSSGASFNLLQKMQAAVGMARGRALVVTHIDGENADFGAVLESLRQRVGELCIPINVPDTSGHGFSAVKPPEGDWRKRFSDRVMDACEDEELLMQYLDTGELDDAQLHRNV